MKENLTATMSPTAKSLPPVPQGEVHILPIGGVGRIGLNWTLYGTHRGWLLVDAGIGFPDDANEGDFMMPDPDFLRAISRDVKALLVTHAHDDHIGAIQHLWPDVMKCPIRATPYCAGILHGRFKERGTEDRVEIGRFTAGTAWNEAGFRVTALPVTHSTPEAMAFVLEAEGRRILHTGDWKDDRRPVIGRPMDWQRFDALGRKGVDVLVCDSTNAESFSPSTCEADVQAGFEHVMRNTHGMVIVACFGSNVARVASVAKAARATHRQVALAGRSMRNSEEVARGLGILQHVPEFLSSTNHLRGLNRNETVLACTGTQGEQNAALARLSRGEMEWPGVHPGDVVIMSAREIPGREEGIAAVINDLEDRGVKVMRATDRPGNDLRLHVTGHATRSELARMHQAVKPGTVVPVHGNPSHLAAHAALAHEHGFGSFIPHEGGIMRVTEAGVEHVGEFRIPVSVQNRDDMQPPPRRRNAHGDGSRNGNGNGGGYNR